MEKMSRKLIKTKASKISSMKLQPIVFLAFLSLALISVHSVSVQAQIANSNDLVVLSHRFEDSRFSSEIIGEILNNDTRSYDKFDIDIYANFRDSAGMLVSSEQGFIDAEELGPLQSSAFNVFVFGDDIADRASTYDLIINDDRLVTGQPLGESYSISSDIGVGGISSGNDNDNGDNDDGNSNPDPPECDDNERVNPSTGECEGFACIPEDTDCDGDMDPPFVDPDEEPIEDEENDNDDGDDSDEQDESDNGEEGGGGEQA